MSEALADTPSSAATGDQKLIETWKERIKSAKHARRPYVPIWSLNLAFAAGQHWVAWDRRLNRVRSLRELDPRFADRELYIADKITQYRMAELGELESDDDRPQMLTTQEGEDAEKSAEQLNRALGYAWDFEWGAEEALKQARLYTLDLGTSAIRCRWDPNRGPHAGHLAIHPDTGQAVLDKYSNDHLEENGVLPDGSLPKFKSVKEGRTCWEAYSSFGILAQPGVNHEKDFDWECLVRPVSIECLQDEYGAAASGLQEDPDIASAMGLSTNNSVPDARSQGVGSARLKNHVWVYTCFQRPNQKYPNGYVAVIASNEYKLLDFQEQLPYETPAGEPHSGVVYLHWWRLNDRFYSRAFIEPLKDPQRIINRRKTQNIEIIDRGMPGWFVKKGDLPEAFAGSPGEIIELDRNAQAPIPKPGIGPGPWMYQDIQALMEDLGDASTVAAIRLGENPEGVDTFSQLALLNDNETSKRATILRDHRKQIATLVELGVYDIKNYWPTQKEILIAGQDDQIDAATFTKERIPTFYMAKVATGAPEPRSQGAELKKVDSVWAALVQSWVAVQNGAEYAQWYFDCLQAGKLLDLPEAKADTQGDLAQLENELMKNGQVPQVMDYDNISIHLPVHREAEDEARAAGDTQTLATIIRHIQDHQQVAQLNAQNAANAAQGIPPLPVPGSAPADPLNAGNPFANYVPRPREPMPQVIGHDFGELAAGQ